MVANRRVSGVDDFDHSRVDLGHWPDLSCRHFDARQTPDLAGNHQVDQIRLKYWRTGFLEYWINEMKYDHLTPEVHQSNDPKFQ